MVWMDLYKKIVARLLILIYLLIGAGMGSAVLLCEKAEAFPHLEFMLSGDCSVTSSPVAGCKEHKASTLQPSLTLLSEADCRDTQLSFSHIRDRAKNVVADPITPDWPLSLLFAIENSPVTTHKKLNLGVQLPPSQALTALRTVILLN